MIGLFIFAELTISPSKHAPGHAAALHCSVAMAEYQPNIVSQHVGTLPHCVQRARDFLYETS